MGERRVLIVDDNLSDRLIVKLLSEKCDFLSSEAGDVPAALELLAEVQYGLFIIDLQMPKIPGLELVRRLRRMDQYKKTPILIMSGRNRPQDVYSAVQAGANDYIVKPMDLQILEEKIKRLTQAIAGGWKFYDVPTEHRHSHAAFAASVLTLNEVGADVVLPFQLPEDQVLSLQLDLLIAKGVASCLSKVENFRREQGQFIYRVRFVGLTENELRQIRLVCRELWTAEQAKAP